MKKNSLIGVLFTLFWLNAGEAWAEILVRPQATQLETYAAREFQRYWYQLTGKLLPVERGAKPGAGREPVCGMEGCRSQQKAFQSGPDTLLTYIAADAALSFTDNGEDFQSRPLSGSWRYRVAAVDRLGFESPASATVAVKW